MKKLIFLLTALAVCVIVIPPQESNAALSKRNTYVIVSTLTPTGDGTFGWSFQNRSTDVEVLVETVDIFNCSASAITGGIAKFEISIASAVTDGGLQFSTYSFTGSSAFPANVTASTGPASITLENNIASVDNTSFLSPAYIDIDEDATTNLRVTYDFRGDKTQSLILPKNSARGLVLSQTQVGSTDFTVGCVGVRVMFTTK